MKKSLLALVLGATLTLAACDQANQAKDAAATKMEAGAEAVKEKAAEVKQAVETK